MHVPVDDGDALCALHLLGVTGGDCCIVEETEPHGLCGFRMVAGRAGRNEDVVGGTRKHVIYRHHRSAYAGQRRLQAFRRDIGVGLDAVDLAIFLGNLAHDGQQMLLRMRQKHGILVGLRRLLADQPLEIRMFERNVQRSQPIRPLGMAFRRDVFKEDRMFVKTGRHSLILPK